MHDAIEAEPPPRRPSAAKGWGLALGIGLVGLLHCALFGVAVLFDAPRLFYLIGVTQIVYIVPAWLVLRGRQRKFAALGVVLAAALTALLCGACFWTFGTYYF